VRPGGSGLDLGRLKFIDCQHTIPHNHIQIRGWLAMLDAQGSGGPEGKSPPSSAEAATDNEAERRKMRARHELETITTAVEVFKVRVCVCWLECLGWWSDC
jgi:hypothetical protein